MRAPASLLVFLVAAMLVVSASASASAADPAGSGKQSFPTTSWALGVVVPNGAGLQGGGKLNWEGVANLTAAVTLPSIALPDAIVYAVMSVMASDGSVMQTAAGVYPNRTVWLAYAWSIPGSTPPTYQWMLNGSAPQMPPGANISMSIFTVQGGWGLRVSDRDTGDFVYRQFPSGIPPALKAGDQEVFALESYSRSGATFQRMGNLTLHGILVDGEKVTSGFYAYGDWDPTHDPVFVVGSSGATPPSFISLDRIGSGSFAWGFAGFWGTSVVDYSGLEAAGVVLLAVGGALVALFIAYKVGGRMSRVRRR